MTLPFTEELRGRGLDLAPVFREDVFREAGGKVKVAKIWKAKAAAFRAA